MVSLGAMTERELFGLIEEQRIEKQTRGFGLLAVAVTGDDGGEAARQAQAQAQAHALRCSAAAQAGTAGGQAAKRRRIGQQRRWPGRRQGRGWRCEGERVLERADAQLDQNQSGTCND